MTDDPDAEEWPEYHKAPHDATFALGVISATYPKLEIAFEQVFTAATDINMAFTASLIPKIGNDVRKKLMEEWLSNVALPAQIDDAIRYFLKSYDDLAFNRNMLMHSQILPAERDPSIFVKAQRDGKFVGCVLTVTRLREIADEMEAIRNYGEALANHIRAPRLRKNFTDAGLALELWPLPDKPPPPVRLEYSPTPGY
jgi:hypothetical protein